LNFAGDKEQFVGGNGEVKFLGKKVQNFWGGKFKIGKRGTEQFCAVVFCFSVLIGVFDPKVNIVKGI
jgi:hypothetical protein